MKKLLLAAAFVSAMSLSASAEYVVAGQHGGGEGSNFIMNGRFIGWIIDKDARTVSLSYENSYEITGELRIPETLEYSGTRWDDATQSEVSFSETYRVVQIHADAFSCQSKITSVIIPAGVEVIGPQAFFCCNGIRNITIEAGETPLEIYPQHHHEMGDPSPIDNITVNRSTVCNAATQIPEVGYYSSTLYFPPTTCNSVTIGSGVKELGAGLFNGLTNVNRVDIANWGTWFNDVKLGDIYSNPYRYGNTEIYVGGLRFTSLEIPEGTVEIPDYKLAGLKYNGELFLPSTLKRIGAGAFYNQKGLYYISFPEGLESIGAHAFYGCETLEFDALPSTLTSIGDYAFAGCETLTSVTLPEGLTELGEGAFARTKNLKKAVLFSELTELKGHTFEGCIALEKVYLPKQLRTIGEKCFRSTWSLSEITFPETLEEIGRGAFLMGWIDEDIYYPQPDQTKNGLEKLNLVNVKKIGFYSFSGCDFVTADLGMSLEEVGEGAFSGCMKLKSVSFPETLKTIKEYAFDFWMRYNNQVDALMPQIKLPASLTTLEANSFNCDLGEMTIPDGITVLKSGSCGNPAILNLGAGIKTIEDGAIGWRRDSSFARNLRLIRIHASTPPTVAAAFPFTPTEYDNITLVVNNGCKDAYTRSPRWRSFNIVEESECEVTVHVTGEAPLAEEIRLQSGIMPSRVSKMTVTGTLSESDFRIIRENMLSLYSLNLAGITNTTLPDGAFSGMTHLTDVVLPSKLTSVSNSAFNGCTLVNIPGLPDGVTSIGDGAFYGCSLIDFDKFPSSLESIGSSAFSGAMSLRSFTAGNSLHYLGYNAFGNCSLLDFADLSASSIIDIPYGLFQGCINLSNVLLPDGVQTIGEYAFANSALEAIELPESVRYISPNAFNNTRLRAATIPENVEEINSGIFANCPQLVSVNFPSTIRSINTGIFENSMRLTAISCSAIEAPAAVTGAFSGIRAAKCTLTVPTVSFRSYLNAPQWGMFSDLINRIAVEIPSDNVDVTSVTEEEYQEMAQEAELDAKAEEPQTAPARMKARRAARESLLSGSNFARLFDGSTLGSSTDSKGTRIFINPKNGATLRAVMYNGKDITSQMEGNSLLLAGGNGTLQILLDNASVETVNADGAVSADEPCRVFNLTGTMVFEGTRSDAFNALDAGIYVIRYASSGKTEKIVIK